MLLDVRMPGMDGIEAARHLAALDDPPAVIFTTAYDEYAVEAFETQAVGYLLKPVRQEKLARALHRAARVLGAQLAKLAGPDATRPAAQQICARLGDQLRLIPLADVYYFMADQKYVTVRHRGGSDLIDESLRALAEEFAPEFVRVHRNSLVAVGAVSAVERDADGRYLVRVRDCDDALPVSRRHAAEALRQIQRRTLNEFAGTRHRPGIDAPVGAARQPARSAVLRASPACCCWRCPAVPRVADRRAAVATAGVGRAARFAARAVELAARGRLGGRPRLAAAIVTVLTILLFLLPVAMIAGAVAAQSAQLLSRLERHAPQLDAAARWISRSIPCLRRPSTGSGSHTSVTVEQMQDWIVRSEEPAAVDGVVRRLGRARRTRHRGELRLMLFVLFFVLRDGPDLRPVVRMLPIEERRRSRLWLHLIDVTRAVFMGIGLTALAQGILLGIGFCHRRPARAAGLRRARGAVRADPAGRHGDRLGARGPVPAIAGRLRPCAVPRRLGRGGGRRPSTTSCGQC